MVRGREVGGLVRFGDHNHFSKFPFGRKICSEENGIIYIYIYTTLTQRLHIL